MSASSDLTRKDAFQVLEETSRTFFIPISRLPDGLREAVASAYLCMRSIDEIEDQRQLEGAVRGRILHGVSRILQSTVDGRAPADFQRLFAEHAERLPEVTLRIGEWAELAPEPIRIRVWDSTAAMADRMGEWAEAGFRIETEADLNRYTYGVAGAVGILLADLWAWHDGTQTDRTSALGFGRGLQAVNILRNRDEDQASGVDFFPVGWQDEQMQSFARSNLDIADVYTESLPAGPIREFCAVPLALAHATLDALVEGREKLTRTEVVDVVRAALGHDQ